MLSIQFEVKNSSELNEVQALNKLDGVDVVVSSGFEGPLVELIVSTGLIGSIATVANKYITAMMSTQIIDDDGTVFKGLHAKELYLRKLKAKDD